MVNEYVAVDVETTGLNPQRDRLLEIGAIRVCEGEPAETLSVLINTGIPVPARIQELTGITDEMQKTGKKAGEAIREFLEFRGALPVVGHNVSFDFGFLKQAAVDAGGSFEAEAMDTLKIARRLLPDLEHRSLEYLCTHYGIAQERKHRAEDDARSARCLYERLRQEFPDCPQGIFLPGPLVYQVKKQSPITPAQKGYLKDLLKYHKIELPVKVDSLTKNEASRIIDRIILEHGRILR